MMEAVVEAPIIVRVQRGGVNVYCRCGEVLTIGVEELLRKRKVEVSCRRGHNIVVELKDVLFLRITVESVERRG